jgi:hypothetical protein
MGAQTQRSWSPEPFFAELHSQFYWVFFEARATNSSNLESKSFRTGDSFDCSCKP